MSKKTMKILTTIATILLIVSIGTSIVYGATGSVPSPIEIKPDAGGAGVSSVKTFGGKLMGVLQTAAVVVSVIILIVLGIKYMVGSAEEKAEYKKTMIPYLVGAILIFAAGTIANIIYEFATGLQG